MPAPVLVVAGWLLALGAPAAASADPATGKEVSRLVLIGAVSGEGLIILSITGVLVIVWAVAIYLFARDK